MPWSNEGGGPWQPKNQSPWGTGPGGGETAGREAVAAAVEIAAVASP